MSTTRSSYQRESSSDVKTSPGFLLNYYRKIITSTGMVQFILGLAFVISWIIIPSMLFNVDLAIGICFLMSGTIAFFCGNFRSRYIVYATMISSFLTLSVNIALLLIVVYASSVKNSVLLFSPFFVVYLVYILFGIGFSFLSTKYSYLSSRILNLKTLVNKEYPTDYSSVEAVTNMTEAPQVYVIRRQQQPIPMAKIIDVENANTNSNRNPDTIVTATSSL